MLKSELKITIQGELPALNEYIDAVNRNRFIGNRMKQEATNAVAWQTKKYKDRGLLPPFHITFNWFCKNRRKDKDNISAFGRKCILDGLQVAGVIPQDNWNTVDGFSDFFFLDKENPRIEIIIKTITQG